jgi:drug/metabolite transporter (DMT)-like permease
MIMNNKLQRILRNGPLWLFISAIMFAVMAVLVRLAGLAGIPGSESTVVRFMFALLVVALYRAVGLGRIEIHRPLLWTARGVVGGTAILFYFLSLAAAKGPEATPLTNSVFFGNSYFVYAPIFAAILLRERLCLPTALMIIIAFTGLYLISQVETRGISTADIYGLLAGILGGLGLVIVRELRKDSTTTSIFLSLAIFGLLAGLVTMPFERIVLPSTEGWLLLILIGISSTVGQLAFTYAMRFTRTGEAGIIQLSTVVYSSLAGVLWFGDPFNARILIGAVLVLGSAAYITLAYETCDQ